MTQKIRMILAMILAVMMLVFVSVPSVAEETINDDEWLIEDEEVVDAEDEEADEEEEFLFDDDDWGFVAEEVIAQYTPEMTQEFIHADDPDWVPEENQEVPAEEAPVAEETAVNEPVAEKPAVEEPAVEEPAVEETVKEEPAVEETAAETPAVEETVTEKVEEIVSDEPVSAEPVAAEPEAEATEAPAEANEEPAASGEVTVTVTTAMTEENLMKLTAVVNDPEGRSYTFQWQVSEDGGENYEDVEDATEDELEIELTDENISNLWRVKVQQI